MTPFNTIPLTHIAATLAGAMGAPAPKSSEGVIEVLADYIRKGTASGKVDRILVYNPDAVGQWIVERYPDKFAPVRRQAPFEVPMLSVFPPKTPVCFASIYSGASPAVHGIQEYVKPVLAIDTLFDALVRAGKKPCIVSVAGQSMDRIFRERPMEYYSLPDDEAVVEKALSLIEEDRFDFLAVYNQAYDDRMHRSHPRSLWAKAALDRYAASFERLGEAVGKHWKDHDSLVAYMPDHGVHREWYLLGQHGKNIPEDMNVTHFYGLKPASAS